LRPGVSGTDGSREAAVVLNMYATGLAIARNLAPHGVPVYGLSSRFDAPGNFSRWCRPFRSPDSQDEPDRLVDYLMTLADSLPGRAVLFPTRDQDIHFLERNREALAARYTLPQMEGDPLDRIMNKHRLAEAAEAEGVPTARTARVRTSAEMDAAAVRFRYPVVVKPVFAHHWRAPGIADAVGRRKAVRISSREELQRFFHAVEPFAPDLLLQEWIQGPDDQCHVLGAYRSPRGEWLGWFTARKMLQFPPEFGLGCVVRLTSNPDVAALGMRLLEALSFWGTAEVEFKRDPESGEYRLIEVNPRHWDQHALGLACGVNLAWIAYRDLTGKGALAPEPPGPGGGYWVSGAGLLHSIRSDLKAGRFRPGTLAGLLRPGTRYAVWDPSDPAPFWRTAWGGPRAPVPAAARTPGRMP
jgi:D-aspartate ligase